MNKKVISLGFVGLLLAVSLVNLLYPKRNFSENENRYLQQFPAFHSKDFMSGKFTSQFESYASDQFIARDGWISLKTFTELALFKKDNRRVYFGKENTLFDATETIDRNQLALNANAIAEFAQKLRKKSPALNVSVLLIPTASAILKDKLPAFAPVPDQQAAIDQVTAAVYEDATVCDPTALLMAQAADYLYYRTDHHWTTDAAYLVYTKWAKDNGLEPLSQDAFAIEQVSDTFYGTTFSKANLFTIPPDSVNAYRFKQPIAVSADYGKGKVTDSLYFDNFLTEKDKYSYFLGGNQPQIEIHTATKNGKTLLILQDSYAHCFVPFLTAHYENILVLDPRYLNIDFAAYAKEKGVTDLLVLYNVPNFSVDKNVSRIVQ